MNAPLSRRQMDEHNHAIAVMRSHGQRPPTLEQLIAERDDALDGIADAMADQWGGTLPAYQMDMFA